MKTSKNDLANQLRALAHPVRLEIIAALAQCDNCCCGEIVKQLPIAQSTVSQHLKVLKEAGLIECEIDGQRCCYCLNRDCFDQVQINLSQVLNA